jgi:hypothetical protein
MTWWLYFWFWIPKDDKETFKSIAKICLLFARYVPSGDTCGTNKLSAQADAGIGSALIVQVGSPRVGSHVLSTKQHHAD